MDETLGSVRGARDALEVGLAGARGVEAIA